MNAPRTESFDCLEKKAEWQAWAAQALEGLSPEQRRRRTGELIAEDPILGPIWKRLDEKPERAPRTTDKAAPAG